MASSLSSKIIDKDRLINDITTQTHLSPSAADAAASTLITLQRLSDRDLQINFLPSRLLLLPPSKVLPNDEIQNYLYELAGLAQVAANAQAYSSILAGGGSESDETGDVAFWLGERGFGEGHENEVLETLGLVKYDKVVQMELSPKYGIPVSSGSGPHVEVFAEHVRKMENGYSFRVSAPGVVLFFLVGRVQGQGWGGLLGIGIWSDE